MSLCPCIKIPLKKRDQERRGTSGMTPHSKRTVIVTMPVTGIYHARQCRRQSLSSPDGFVALETRSQRREGESKVEGETEAVLSKGRLGSLG